jgi:hypothetical protein
MSVLYERPDFKSATTKAWPLYALLLLGDAGLDEFRIIAEFPQRYPFVTELRNGGIHILRKFGDWLLLKNNPDPFPASGHNHADLLNLLLFFDGRPVLVDAGTYRFSDDKGIRNALRGTTAHNTIAIDKRGQAEPLRNFDWSRTVKPGFTQVHEDEDFALIDAQHDSYHDIGVTHRRVVLWFKTEDALLVIDQVQGQGAHAIDQYWHFPPGMRVEDTGSLTYRLSNGGQAVAYLRFLRSKDRDHNEVLAGSESNPAFYYSPRYGAVEPGIAVRHSWTSALSASHGTHRIALFSKKNAPVEFGDVWHAEFLFNGWTIDLTQTPAKVARSKV